MSEESQLLAVMQARHARELTALLEFSNRLLGHHSVDSLMRHLVEEVRRLLRADACSILLPDPTGSGLNFAPRAAGATTRWLPGTRSVQTSTAGRAG